MMGVIGGHDPGGRRRHVDVLALDENRVIGGAELGVDEGSVTVQSQRHQIASVWYCAASGRPAFAALRSLLAPTD